MSGFSVESGLLYDWSYLAERDSYQLILNPLPHVGSIPDVQRRQFFTLYSIASKLQTTIRSSDQDVKA